MGLLVQRSVSKQENADASCIDAADLVWGGYLEILLARSNFRGLWAIPGSYVQLSNDENT